MVNSTFIIPIRVDSDKRLENIHVVVDYILKWTDSHIIVTERDEYQKVFLKPNKKLNYSFENIQGGLFHRTKLINQMILKVTTPITINCDADVILQKNMYKICENKIIIDGYDLVYPYGLNKNHQLKIFNTHPNYEKFKLCLDETLLLGYDTKLARSQYGHIQFFRTNSYINGYMENENFKEYGPEDAERGIRFDKLGYKVYFFNDIELPTVFHLEHPIVPLVIKHLARDSNALYEKLKKYSKQDLIKYYENQDYLTEYKRRK